ncbi:MAG: ISNCY family transposase [Chloroflexi bacterium]|jgi:IS5 family transposase|nr:ISNCY family transposase [Chloroflexota bacterium]
MLIDKHEADNILKRIPGLIIKMSPELTAIDQVLNDDELFCMIRDDLAQRYPKTLTAGRKSTPVEVILRMLAIKHLYDLSYEQAVLQVADSLVLRQFCRVYLQATPDQSTLCRWANLIQPQTLQAFNQRIMNLAIDNKLTHGRKLRMDGTVVETTIHHPTDSRLLADSVRVLGRTLTRAKTLLGSGTGLSKEMFRNRQRSAKRSARKIAGLSQRSREQMKSQYKRLVQTTRATVRQAERVLTELQNQVADEGHKLIETLQTFLPRTQQVIDQTVRRMFSGEKVPPAEKLVSIFEPHTDIIRRGKPNKDTEFGHKIWLGEVEGGFIAQYEVLDGNPNDESQWQPTLENHVQLFGRPPQQTSADRGVHSADNEAYAVELGVKRVILPKSGRKSEKRRQHERQRWFRRGRRFHAGVEGRISVIKRKHGLDRCRNRGQDGFERWVGWGVIANNLTAMAKGLSP